MSFIERMFTEGGLFMYVILFLGLLHGLPILVQLFVAKKADFTPYLWGGLGSIVLIGVLGAMVGLTKAFEALAYVAPEMRMEMAMSAASIALYPVLLALLVCLPGVLLTGMASSLTRSLTPRRAGKG